jgi:hypothetical protein
MTCRCVIGVFACLLIAGLLRPAFSQAPATAAPQAAAGIAEKEWTQRQQLLTSRITELYVLLRDSGFRQAEAYYTDDSKEAYYNTPKRPINSFTVKEVKMKPDGRSASATVEIKFSAPNMPSEMTLPQKSRWVYEKDNWYTKLPPIVPNPLSLFAGRQDPQNAVLLFEKTEQQIARGQNVYVFPFKNASKQPVEVVFVDDPCDCLEASVDKPKLEPGESAKLTVKSDIELTQQARAFSIQVYARPMMKVTNLIFRLP